MILECIGPSYDEFWKMYEMMFSAILWIFWVKSALRPLLLGMCWSPKRVQNLGTAYLASVLFLGLLSLFYQVGLLSLFYQVGLLSLFYQVQVQAHPPCPPTTGVMESIPPLHKTKSLNRALKTCAPQAIWHIKMLYMILYQSPLQHLQLRRWTKLRWALHCE